MDHSDVVKDLAARHPFDKTTEAGIFAFIRRVAWALKDEGCGLLVKPGGENIFNYKGTSYSISRICYPPGADGEAQIYKILSDAGPGGQNGPQWVDDGKVEGNRYRPALPPDDDVVGVPGMTLNLAPIFQTALAPLLAALEEQKNAIAALKSQVDGMSGHQQPAVELPKKIALRDSRGNYLSADQNGGAETPVRANRSTRGAWETFDFEAVK
jgi:hypothetical protein